MRDQIVLFIRIVLFLGMVICFTWQSMGSFQKFLDGRTSIAESDVKKGAKPLPPFSICAEPPFDENFMRIQYNTTPSLFLFSSHLTKGMAKGKTFPTNLSSQLNSPDALHNIYMSSTLWPQIYHIGNDEIILERFEADKTYSEIGLFDKHHSLWYGKCHSFVLKVDRQASDILFMGFQFLDIFG